MKAIAAVLSVMLAGCAVYRVAPKDDSSLRAVRGQAANIQITKVNKYPEGFQCFEPMLLFITVGIIPVHCVNTYTVSVTSAQNVERASGTYEETEMQGWFPLLLLPFPGWHYGFGQDVKPVIEDMLRSDGK